MEKVVVSTCGCNIFINGRYIAVRETPNDAMRLARDVTAALVNHLGVANVRLRIFNNEVLKEGAD